MAAGLLERERELAVISRAIDDVAACRAGLLLVEGPAGIGKSRLVSEARRQAADRGMLVLSARGGEIEREFPFGVVRQLLEACLVDPALRGRVLAGAAAASGPVFDGWSTGSGEPPNADGTFSVLHGLYWLAVNLSAEAPLVVTVDDLHWCDRPSLRFLAYLARRLEGLPALVVGSLRPSEPGADQALLAELTSDPLGQVLLPGALSAPAAAALVRERLGEDVAPVFAEACHAATRGNPLLLSELLKALVAEGVRPDAASIDLVGELGPRAASRAVLLRLARLQPDAVAVARSIAVLGEGAELATVAALADIEATAAAAATRDLVQAEILRSEAPLGFVHPLVQAAVYRDLSPGERELHHARAARLLVELGAPAEQVAAHLLAVPARGEEWVVELLREAAAAALRRGAPDSAASALSRALDEPPPPAIRPAVLLELGRAEAMTSLVAAAEHLRSAYEQLDDPIERALAAEGLTRALVFSGRPDEAAAIAGSTWPAIASARPDLAHRVEAVELLSLYFGARDQGDILGRLRARRSPVSGRDPGGRMLDAVAAWEMTLSAEPVADAVALARAALVDGVLLAADSGLMGVVATLVLAIADEEDAVAGFDAIRADAHRSGSIFTISGAQLWGGFTQSMRGELVEAEQQLRASLETLALWGVPGPAAWSSGFLADVLVQRGLLVEARAVLEAAAQPPPTSDMAAIVDRAWLSLLLAEGRVDEALSYSERCPERAGWRRNPRYVTWRGQRARALDRAGRSDEAFELAREEVEWARAFGAAGTVGRALRVLGTIERDEGIPHLEEACAVLERAPARLERAKALAALGMALRRARRPTEAREPLRAALELAEVCGARPLVEELRAEIHATGARPRTAAARGIGSLTASERRIVGLAADGQSNRDIAQVLYVTPKTVEVHLSNAYRKLGIGGRRDLARALAAAT